MYRWERLALRVELGNGLDDVGGHSSKKGWYLYVCKADLLAKAENAAEKYREFRRGGAKRFWGCSDPEIAWCPLPLAGPVSGALTEVTPQYSIVAPISFPDTGTKAVSPF